MMAALFSYKADSQERASSLAPKEAREGLGEPLLDVPRALVWAAITDPQQAANQRGPNGFGRTIRKA